MVQHVPSSNEYSMYFPPGAHALYESLGFGARWNNFTFDELKCKGTGSLRVHYETMDALQVLRNYYGGPITVTSYYRDPEYNRQVGGAEDSLHMQGRAVDTTTLNGDMAGRAKLVHLATLSRFRGFGFYRGFTHIDTGRTRFWCESNLPLFLG